MLLNNLHHNKDESNYILLDIFINDGVEFKKPNGFP